LTLAVLAAALVQVIPAVAQDGMKQEGMTHNEKAKALYTGKFHGKVHQTAGRATVYSGRMGSCGCG